MSESQRHLDGIAALERFVLARSGHRTDLILYRDVPQSDAQRKPPIVGGFRPDLFARTWKDGAIVIGEAKTTRDLKSARSIAQIAAFVNEALASKIGTFVLSVPIGAAASARVLLRTLAAERSNFEGQLVCISPETYEVGSPKGF